MAERANQILAEAVVKASKITIKDETIGSLIWDSKTFETKFKLKDEDKKTILSSDSEEACYMYMAHCLWGENKNVSLFEKLMFPCILNMSCFGEGKTDIKQEVVMMNQLVNDGLSDQASSTASKPSEFISLFEEFGKNKAIISDAIGFACLMLMRCSFKSHDTVKKALNDKFFKLYNSLFKDNPLTVSLNPINESNYKIISSLIDKSKTEMKKIVSFCLEKYLEGDNRIQSILLGGFMLHSKGMGMGPVMLMREACLELKISLDVLLEHMASVGTAESLSEIVSTLEAYNEDKLWWWSRLLDDRYFSNMTFKRHRTVSLRLAAIIQPKNADIFMAKALNAQNEDVDAAKFYVAPIIDKFAKVNVMRIGKHAKEMDAYKHEKAKKLAKELDAKIDKVFEDSEEE